MEERGFVVEAHRSFFDLALEHYLSHFKATDSKPYSAYGFRVRSNCHAIF